jgi:predicted DNA-binding transcriptional regulator AlpA
VNAVPRTPQYDQSPPPGHVWADEASRLAGRSIEQLYKDRQKQKRTGRSNGPWSVSVGRKAAWREADIEAWLDGQAPSPDAEQQHNSRPAEVAA